jgi:type IV secretion system protein VirD4
MHNLNRGWRLLASIFLIAVVIAVGWPTAFVAVHGWNADAWPNIAGMATPREWSVALSHIDPVAILGAYWQMAHGLSPAFAGGGTTEVTVLAVVTLSVSTVLVMAGKAAPMRDPSGAYGNVDWASQSELAAMNAGLELGISPDTGLPVRAQVEGNLVTIAPPRSGKTGGFIIPNLTFPEPNAWAGPAIVVDPKGDAYRAVRRRRTALGKTLRCLDPLGYVGGKDRWNPLCHVDPADVLYLQAMALALLPQPAQQTEAGAYFRSRAADLLVGALQCCIRDGHPDPVQAAQLLSNHKALLESLEANNHPAASAAREILEADDRTRDGIVSTVRQATQWLLDERMRTVVQDHTFELSDLGSGDVDLFIVLPADDRKKIIAPFVRWLLADLFTSVRQNRPAERIVAFIDEAYVLGRFDAILDGVGELPGYGISLWTIWQSRYQMVDAYGENGAEILLGTAEVTNVFNLPAVQPDELERWSESIGNYTGMKTTKTRDNKTGDTSESNEPEERRLVVASDLPEFFKQWQVAFLTSETYTRNRLKLQRSLAYTDARFRGLIDIEPPVGKTR